MIPLHDDIACRRTPVVNYAFIALCAVVFLLQLQNDKLIEQYGMIPKRVVEPAAEIEMRQREYRQIQPGVVEAVDVVRPAEPAKVPPWLTLLTCAFLHGGWLHVIGNLWFLHIFGDNVEDRFGHFGYLAIYLGCGVVASLSHLAVDPGSMVPTIGASGAVAGVMGAYFVLYPRARVLALVPAFVIFFTVAVPAPVFLGIWFLIQFFQGAASISAAQQAGVAWWAHIGGFVAGAAVAGVARLANRVGPPQEYGSYSGSRGNGRIRFR